jgi:hypothetical protein
MDNLKTSPRQSKKQAFFTYSHVKTAPLVFSVRVLTSAEVALLVRGEPL